MLITIFTIKLYTLEIESKLSSNSLGKILGQNIVLIQCHSIPVLQDNGQKKSQTSG